MLNKNIIGSFLVSTILFGACKSDVWVYRRQFTSDKGDFQTLWMVSRDSILEYSIYEVACYPPVFFQDTIFNERHDVKDSIVFETEIWPFYKKNEPKWSKGTFHRDELEFIVRNNNNDSIFYTGFESVGGSGFQRFLKRDTIMCGNSIVDAFKFEFYRPENPSVPQIRYVNDTIPEFIYLDARTFFPIQFEGDYITLKTDSVFTMKRKEASLFFQNRRLNIGDSTKFLIKPKHSFRRVGLNKI